jgi:hypothetical protein
MTKIKVTLDVNQSRSLMKFDLEDLNLTQKEWDGMDEAAKTKLIQTAVDHEPNQPYWIVDEITETI